MKNNVLTIIKKELARFFGDKRMVFVTVLMPGLMIYVIYCLMGDFMMDAFLPDEEYVGTAYVQNFPEELADSLKEISVEWNYLGTEDAVENVKTQIREKETDLLVIFPENFTDIVSAYDVTSGEAAPNVEVYYNSTKTESQQLAMNVSGLLDAYEASMSNKFDVNAGEEIYDCATEKDTTGRILSMMMPMLLMIFLYSGCISVAPESIAGEKERGTIATMLVTPMKRSSLAVGKILSLSIIALMSGLSSFLGTFLSLPKLLGTGETGINANVYTISDYALLLMIIFSTVLVMVGVISLVSALAKSTKEAGTMVSPLMILIMLLSLAPMFIGEGTKSIFLFLIPLFNSAVCMNGIFSFTYEPMQVVVTIVMNLFFTGIMTYLLKKMFDSEKLMFAH